MKTDRHLSYPAAEVPVKLLTETKILTSIPRDSTHKMLWWDVAAQSIEAWNSQSHYYTPRFNEVERGVYWYHLVRLSGVALKILAIF